MQFPITIGLHRSFLLRSGIVLVALAAVAVVCRSSWPMVAKALTLCALALGGCLAWHRSNPSVTALRLSGEGGIECRLAGEGDFHKACLQGSTVVHPWLTVIRLSTGRRHEVVVCPDAIDADDFRRLRVWLRWKAKFSASPDDA